MTEPSIAFATPTDAPKWKRRLVYSPLARIVIFIGLMAAITGLASLALRVAGFSAKEHSGAIPGVGKYVMLVSASVLSYLFLTRVVERRIPAEFAIRGALRNTALGAVSGAALMTVIVAALWIAGAYQITRVNPEAVWWPALLTAGIGAAVFEEILFRGVIYRITEEGLGTWPALLISTLFFGGLHIFNPGATVWGAVAIAVEAGLLFGLLYNVTRSLWLCIGLHMGWNFTQGTVWGVPVSGFSGDSFLVATRPGPEWLTGGNWGAEASVVAVAACLLVSAVLATVAVRRNTLVKRAARPKSLMQDSLPAAGAA